MIVAIGVVLAIVAGLMSYLLPDVKSIVSFVAGLQVTMLAVQIEYLVRQNGQTKSIIHQLSLTEAVSRIAWMPRLVKGMAESIEKIEQRFPDSPAMVAARKLIEDSDRGLKQLERGHIVHDYEDISILLDQAPRTRRSIRATSLQEVDLAWWMSPLGKKYWSLLKAAIDRGVHVERIFIYTEWTDALNGLAEDQHASGVHVFKVRKEDIPPDLQIDMIVWDETCAYRAVLTNNSGGHRNSFTLDLGEIQDMIMTYNRVYSLATHLKGDESSCILH